MKRWCGAQNISNDKSLFQVATRDIPTGDTKEKDRIQQQSKIKVVKMLALVVILFVLSWLPLYAIFTIKKFGKWDFAHRIDHRKQ
jgi:hypothetical protein